jgi:short subunit dehydrogenase-like uncharacterized protein
MVTQTAAYTFAITPPGNRPHSIAVFGCTGNAGRAVAYQVIKSAAIKSESVNIALSGRNRGKVEEVLTGIKHELKSEGIEVKDGSKIEILLADASDEASMLRLAKSTKILVSFTLDLFVIRWCCII